MSSKGHKPLLFGVMLVLLILPVSADAGATKEKCKCDLATANDRNDGAEVSNAAKCFLVTDEERDWCIFDVESLVSSKASEDEVRFDMMLKESIEHSSYDMLTELLSEHFYWWTEWGDGAAVLQNVADIPQHDLRNALSEALTAGEKVLVRCMENFVVRDQMVDEEFIQDDRFGCGVHRSGWLTLKVDVNDVSVYYLREPLYDIVP